MQVMRLIKLSKDVFESEKEVEHYFRKQLWKQKGKFYFSGHIDEDGLDKGELVLFQYNGQLRYIAESASERRNNPLHKKKNDGNNEYFFKVNLETLTQTKPIKQKQLEQFLQQQGLKKTLNGQGWTRIPEKLRSLIESFTLASPPRQSRGPLTSTATPVAGTVSKESQKLRQKPHIEAGPQKDSIDLMQLDATVLRNTLVKNLRTLSTNVSTLLEKLQFTKALTKLQEMRKLIIQGAALPKFEPDWDDYPFVYNSSYLRGAPHPDIINRIKTESERFLCGCKSEPCDCNIFDDEETSGTKIPCYFCNTIIPSGGDISRPRDRAGNRITICNSCRNILVGFVWPQQIVAEQIDSLNDDAFDEARHFQFDKALPLVTDAIFRTQQAIEKFKK